MQNLPITVAVELIAHVSMCGLLETTTTQAYPGYVSLGPAQQLDIDSPDALNCCPPFAWLTLHTWLTFESYLGG